MYKNWYVQYHFQVSLSDQRNLIADNLIFDSEVLMRLNLTLFHGFVIKYGNHFITLVYDYCATLCER